MKKKVNQSPPYLLSLPFYICRHGGDSERTRERYKRGRARLASLFQKKSIQEAIEVLIAQETSCLEILSKSGMRMSRN